MSENGSRPVPPPPAPMAGTPNAEKYVLEADAMRRRQLRSALLHGSRRTWREHPRIWPAIVVGVIAVAVVVAAIAVVDAYQKQKEKKEKQEEETSALVHVDSTPRLFDRYLDGRAAGSHGVPGTLTTSSAGSEGRL